MTSNSLGKVSGKGGEYMASVSVDSLRAYTYAYIDINYLLENEWRKWVNKKDGTTSYFKKNGHLLFWYFPKGILLIKFSVPKFYYGTNAKPYNLDNADLIIKLIDHKIKILFPNTDISSFQNWICTEIHPFVHYYMDNEKDKITYLECLKKMQYLRLKKHTFSTGIQARNGSYALNIYSKFDEIKSRAINKPSSVSDADFAILSKVKNVLRFEYQVKKAYLRRNYKNNRTIKDVLTKQFCENLLWDAIKKANLNNHFLYKNELIQKIENEFGKIKASNLIEFVNDYNEMPKDFIDAKYPQKTQNNYIRILKEKTINPVYLPNKVSEKIDFSNFSEPDKVNFKFLLIKLLIIINLIKKYLIQQINNDVKYLTASSVFSPPAFFFEDGGG